MSIDSNDLLLQKIRAATTFEDLDTLTLEVSQICILDVKECFIEIYTRKANLQLANDDQIGASISRSLSDVFGCYPNNPITGDKGNKAFLSTPTFPNFNLFWKKIEPTAFSEFWLLAMRDDTPPPIKVHLLCALWDSKIYWKTHSLKERGIQFKTSDVIGALPDSFDACLRWFQGQDMDSKLKAVNRQRTWQSLIYFQCFLKQPAELAKYTTELQSEMDNAIKNLPHVAIDLATIQVYAGEVSRNLNLSLYTAEDLDSLHRSLNALEQALLDGGAPSSYCEDVLRVKASFERLRGNTVSKEELQLRRARMLATLADKMPNPFVKAEYWRQAAVAFQEAGDKENCNNAKRSSRACYQHFEADRYERSPSIFHFDETNRAKMLEQFFEDIDSAPAAFYRLGLHYCVSSLDFPKDTTESVDSFLEKVGQVVVVDDRLQAPIDHGTEELGVVNARKSLCLEVDLSNVGMVSPILAEIRSRFEPSVTEYLAVCCWSGDINEEDVPFLETAFERYIAGDYVSTIHILIPRIEQLIRRAITKSTGDATNLHGGNLKEKLLGELLRQTDDNFLFPPPLVKLLQVTLTEEIGGRNLRNRVAHGLARVDEYNALNADRLVHIAFHLCILSAK